MNKETEKLLSELNVEEADRLELEELRRDKSIKDNLEKELDVLKSLFPEITAEDIPDQVFESCENGRGLAAQYALYYVTEQKKKEETQKNNEENAKSAPPEIHNSEDEAYFTPEAVKAMSDKDIRRNYKAIMKSMEKWAN